MILHDFQALALTCGVALATLVGCAEVRGDRPANTAERLAARGLIAQLDAATRSPIAPDAVLRAASVAPALSLLAPPGTQVIAPSQAVAPGQTLSDCATATETTATLNGCELGEHIVDSTWSAQGVRTRAEIEDVFIVGPGLSGVVHVDANLAGAGELSGVVHIDAVWSAQGEDRVLDAAIRVDGLVTEPGDPSCARGGTIAITGGVGGVVSETGPGVTERPTVTLWFGDGGCDDIQIAP